LAISSSYVAPLQRRNGVLLPSWQAPAMGALLYRAAGTTTTVSPPEPVLPVANFMI
jgi:hypothetical protein